MSQLELLPGASLFKTFKPFERFKGIRCPVIPAQAGRLFHVKTENETWMPAFAGMT